MSVSTTARKQIHRSPEQWRELVRAWKRSGQTRAAWCLAEGIGYESLRRWTKRVGHSVSNAPLVEISRKQSAAALSTDVRVRVTREGELELSGAISEEILRSLLRAMRETADVR